MILLDDFSDIVLKTQQLCSQQQDCVRLKNALVNLGNAKDWERPGETRQVRHAATA